MSQQRPLSGFSPTTVFSSTNQRKYQQLVAEEDDGFVTETADGLVANKFSSCETTEGVKDLNVEKCWP